RFGQVGMKVYEYVHARRSGCAYVSEDLDRFRVVTLWWTEIDIDALQAIGRGPLEHWSVGVSCQPHGKRPEHLKHARLIASLDDQKRNPGAEQDLEVVARIGLQLWRFRRVHGRASDTRGRRGSWLSVGGSASSRGRAVVSLIADITMFDSMACTPGNCASPSRMKRSYARMS